MEKFSPRFIFAFKLFVSCQQIGFLKTVIRNDVWKNLKQSDIFWKRLGKKIFKE